MDLKSLIAETTSQLAQAEVDLEVLELELYEKRQQIQALQDELLGLTLAAKRRGELTIDMDDSPDSNVVPMPGMSLKPKALPDLSRFSRSEAVAKVLEVEGRALDRSSIFDLLGVGGCDIDSPDQVSLALTNLKRSGRVHKLGDGRWRLVPHGRENSG